MTQLQVTATRTGFAFHASYDKARTLCGRKVTTVFGPVGTLLETMTMESDEVFLVPAAVSCEKCLEAQK